MNSLQRHLELCAITAVAFFTNLGIDAWLAPDLGLIGVAWGTNAAFAAWAGLITASVAVMRTPATPE